MEQKEIDIAKNKKAGFQYQVVASFEAGIQLTGPEIKSVRARQVSLTDSYCRFVGHELFVKSLHIAPYKEATIHNEESRRDRKLLLNKHELKKILSKSKEKGYTIVPIRMYINERGFAKLEIALVKGKKLYDKREDIKRKDIEREMNRKLKG